MKATLKMSKKKKRKEKFGMVIFKIFRFPFHTPDQKTKKEEEKKN